MVADRTIMQLTNDGLENEEKDCELRGAGDIFGTRQTGEFQFKMADLFAHQHLIEKATSIADNVIKDESLSQKLIERWIGESNEFIWS